jgi:hypothetical protein
VVDFAFRHKNPAYPELEDKGGSQFRDRGFRVNSLSMKDKICYVADSVLPCVVRVIEDPYKD